MINSFSFSGIFTRKHCLLSVSVISCGSFNVTDGSVIAPEGTNFGSEATIECNEGYRIDNASSKLVTCTSSGNWSAVGECISKCERFAFHVG